MINKQAYINAINQNIEIVRGDTLAFNFILHGLGSQEEYEELIFKFAVVENYDDETLIEVTNEDNGITLVDYDALKDNATFTVYIASTLTKALSIARYYYDLQLSNDSDVLTLMRGRFNLLYDVAD